MDAKLSLRKEWYLNYHASGMSCFRMYMLVKVFEEGSEEETKKSKLNQRWNDYGCVEEKSDIRRQTQRSQGR